MGRRSDIDWERIERLYVAGQMTIRQISEECGVAHQSITKKARRDGWQRNLDVAIKARTKAKIAQIDIAHIVEQSAQESSDKSAQTIKRAIEEASDVAAGTIVRHRADIRLCTDRAREIESLLEEHMGKADNLGDVVRAAQAFKSLVDARAKLIDKERESLGIQSGEKDPGDSLNIEVKFV
jgi:hypothetical protein